MTPMTGQRIPVSLGERSYEIVLEPGSSRTLGDRLKPLINTAKIGIITDRHVARHYLKPTVESLKQAGFDPVPIVLPPGERTKTLATVAGILDVLATHRFERGSVPRSTSEASRMCRFLRRWWRRWIPASGGKRASTIAWGKISSARFISP